VDPQESPDTGGRFSMRNWRVATRLNVILLIPVLVALIFGGSRVRSSVDTWQQADDAVQVANLVRAAADYNNALENERDSTAVPLLAGKRNDPTVTAAYAATDAAATAFDKAAADIPNSAELTRRMTTFRAVEPQLVSLRKAAYTRQLSGVQTEEWYVRVGHPLMELANELGYGTPNSAAFGRTLYAVELAKSAESLTRSIGTQILVQKPVSPQELALQKTAMSSYQYMEGIALAEYQGGGTTQDQQRLQAAQQAAQDKGEAEITALQNQAEANGTAFLVPPDLTKMVTDIATPGMTTAKLNAEGVTALSFSNGAAISFDAYRSVEVALAEQATDDARNVASNAKRDAIINSAIVVFALILAFIVAGMMARAMSRSMRRLRGAAFDIAENRLPGMVDQLSRTDPGRVDTRVAPIPITSRDEIGEVARAFDQVHREAVRLAAEQALLRGNVNAIFTNLSQRNQGLIQRQLTLITELENNEGDPDQLEHLFKMDHLATRMRRLGYVSSAIAGNLAGSYVPVAQFSCGSGADDGSGFFYVIRWVPSDAATVSGERVFVGMSSSIAVPTNVDPATLTNCIGVAQLSGDATQLYMVHGGSSAQSTLPLGTNFPGASLSTTAYELAIFAPNSVANMYYYQVSNLVTGNTISGSFSGTAVQVPQSGTLLAPRAWTCNNATALAVGIDVCSIYIETDD